MCLVLVAAGLGAAACSGGGTEIPECNDGVDNDGDGLLDNADPACAIGDTESGDPPVACNDGVDNDGDGLTDFPDDPGCTAARDTDEFNVRVPACMDGMDNDGDGKVDFPNDPGCFVANQDDESDDCPDGPSCPECGDGDDNDADGDTDYPADDGCAAASSPAEFMFDANACGVGTVIADLPANGQVASTLTSGTSNIASATCNGRGTERAYLFVVDHPVTMVASTDSGGTIADTVLYVRRNCMQAASELACSDNISPTNNRSKITVDLTPGTYYLVVDGRDLGSIGPFQLSVIFYEGLGQECTGPANCAPGYTCRAVPPSTTTTCELPVCSDTRDDDGDGKIDFPLDPGCTSATDSDETDPCPGAGCPQCGDGMDNDTDGATDYPMDTSCASASATSEADCPIETDPVITITGAVTSGTTVGASNSLIPTCGSTFTQTAPERVHLLDVRDTLTTLDITLTTSFDAATSILDANCGTTLVCADPNTIARTNVAPGHYMISVDGWSSGSGTYSMTVRGTIATGGTCNSPLVDAGVFTCQTGSACAGPAGMRTCVPAACNDTMDADGDGFNGYPTDPGCTSTQDNDETDDCPTGPLCPQCGNGLDDDGDGMTDYPMDLGCVAASGSNEECISVEPIIPLTANVVGASTAGHTNDIDLSCGVDGRDDIYRLRLTHPLSELRANTVGSAQDTILAIKRGGCATFDLQCDDDAAGAGDSAVFLIDLPAGDYFLIVDDKNVATPSTYNLNVSGLYADGTACDPLSPFFRCNPGLVCAGTAGAETCRPAACNDAIDADGDGFNGYPTDPGCASTSDNDETDNCPSGAGCPVCSDDLDNDSDGFTDYPMDPSCTSAAADSEFAPCISTDPVAVYAGPLTAVATSGHANDVDLSCGVDGRDDVYRVFVSQPLVSLTATTDGSPMNTAVAFRSGTCNGTTDLTCATNNSGTNDATATLNTVAVGEYFVIVDDLNTTTPTTYDLRVTGRIAAGQPCNPTSNTFLCVTGNACYGPAGAETCQVAACNDGVDADGDTFNGYPTDPGCIDISDNDESDNCPSGPGCPVCSDDLDNDGDGNIDFPIDFGCAAASTNSEAECQVETDPLIPITMAATPGTTVGAANNLRPTCGSTITFTAPDRVHIMNIRVPLATLHVDTNPTGFDNAISLSDATCGPTIQCADAPTIDRTNVAPGTYTVIVDGWSSGSGTYTLNVRGTIADGNSCADPLVGAGILSCNPGMVCAGPAGLETCRPAACNDAIDADGDGFNGYPTDPGCATTSDNDETDTCPTGPTCPQCANGIDDDSDGQTDYPMDVGCPAASGTTELGCPQETDPITVISGPVTTGTTVGAANNFDPPCQTSDLGDRVHMLVLNTALATLTIDTEGSTLSDPVLMFMNATCGLPPIQCDDDGGTGTQSLITRTNVPAGTYAIEVDHYQFAGTSGPYVLNVRGTIPSGGACTSPLFTAGALTCITGTTCQAGVCM